ncbi:SRPBCC family protein [Paenibacillus sp. NEAU-GSW1]|uniref:SRPBCC family protein n=1 Tax=Paenibacillus sp. NEAU-GSW1 TaxID=2682486 RepID=UPI0012E2528F|nr:SRPBCC family protein [Paenibacillus sp. NEAU-GSW1]MUT68310.1 polyketide cyclase [Paenibacillus sp. NEAU-GSW1]
MDYKYNFETNWKFEADIEQVWGLIAGFKYDEWWSGVKAEPLQSGLPNGIGEKYRYEFRTKMPYRLSFEAEVIVKEAPRKMEIRSTGELEGRGEWTLTQSGSVTHVRYIWQVNTNKAWMDVLAPLLKPVFVWNHDLVMKEGERGMSKALQAPVIAK